MPIPIRIEDVMSSPVYTTGVETTAADAAAECIQRDVGSLVVVDDDDNVAGIVTGVDLLDVLANVDEPETTPVSERMSSPVVTTTPETLVGDAVGTMAEHDIARLVVLDDGDLVGIVSTDDIVRYVPQVFHRYELEASADEGVPGYTIRRETAYEKDGWEVECVGVSEDQLSVGDRVEFSKTISEQDVRQFAEVSGDTNRLHLDEEYATETRFGGRIVHGTLVSGLISAALARLPGLTIYLSQDLSFLAPVSIGDRVRAVCEIVGTLGENKYELTTDVFDADGEQVIEGEATVLVDALPETAHVEIEALA